MTGQDAVDVAEAFHETLALDGVILTKLDGDARGGAALSVKEVVGRPIAFASTGEKLDDFEQFHPDRMAGRILGMGDMLTPDREGRAGLRPGGGRRGGQQAACEGQFTLEDFLEQMQQVKKMGPLGGPARDAPGHAQGAEATPQIDDRRDRPGRGDHPLDDAGRAARPDAHQRLPARCASPRAAGTTTSDVNALLKQFKEMQKMMKGLGKGGMAGALGGLGGMLGRGPELLAAGRWTSWPRWARARLAGFPGLAGEPGCPRRRGDGRWRRRARPAPATAQGPGARPRRRGKGKEGQGWRTGHPEGPLTASRGR